MRDTPNVQQAVPFLWVTDMEASLRFYVQGLGFTTTKNWSPEGRIRWCWLELGGAALMLQQYLASRRPVTKLGEGVSICFQCRNALALYEDFTVHGLNPMRPFVGNALWVTSLSDPDGYKLEFESPTDAPEESIYKDPSPKST
jgi:catechol 2,3-dioxygenase-like lactoylglutathione lyase family enzyme